jgi:S-formylglutathione hydrolase FrmB
MAFCDLHFWSPSLQKQAAAYVILPEDANKRGPYPVYYLLHGLSDDHTIWLRRTSIERYVSNLPLIVVMPDGERGFYTDAQEGLAFESSITKDLIGLIDRTFPTKAERGGRAIGGLSMGGYGAVKLALKNPNLFCSANSHSGAVAFGHNKMDGKDPFTTEFRRVLGENPVDGPNDCFSLAHRIDRAQAPALRIDCGTEDFLIQSNRDFHAHLEKEGIAHEYQEFPGSHEWGYWDKHVQEALAFHRKALKI